MREGVRHWLDAIAPIFRNEALDPFAVVAVKDHVFCTLNNEPVQADNFSAFQSSRRALEFCEGQFKSGQTSRRLAKSALCHKPTYA